MADRGEGPESEDELYEVVDITEYARRHQWWSRVFGSNTGPIAEKYSVATQIMMGGVTGWCAGYLFQKVGKIAATAVGGGFLLLQVFCYMGMRHEVVTNIVTRKCCATVPNILSYGLILLKYTDRIANHSGYVQVDWKKVKKDVNKAKKHLKKKANKAAPELNSFIEESTEFVKRNIVVSSGFLGGFLLGLAS